jgi:hypothetical protein
LTGNGPILDVNGSWKGIWIELPRKCAEIAKQGSVSGPGTQKITRLGTIGMAGLGAAKNRYLTILTGNADGCMRISAGGREVKLTETG